MQARRIVVSIGAVVLVAAVVLAVRLQSLEPVAPVGDVASGGTHLPASRDQALLAQVGVTPQDVGRGYTASLLDQGDQLSQPTLDLCGLGFASESRRQARRQVVAADSTGEAVFSTEAVLYETQAGAAEAMGEIRGAASRCPATPVSGPDPSTPPLRWQIHPDGDLGGPAPSGVDRVGLSVDTSEGGQSTGREVLVFLRRGRLLVGLYFVQADGPQAEIDGGSTIASTVGVFQTRVAALPPGDLR